MAAEILSASKMQRRLAPSPGGIRDMIERRPNIGWGNLAVFDEGILKKYGVAAAYDAAIHPNSEHLPSSGMSNTMTRKARKEHYRRKAILEVQKAKERRALWEQRNPGAGEANWRRLERARDDRKAAVRAHRRATKRAGRRSSSGSRR
jgi:hypothetical protein